MRVVSFDISPVNGKAIHHVVELALGIICGRGRQMGVFASCQNAAMAEGLLNLKQVNA